MKPSCEDILNNPFASFWIKSALRCALDRDPVDALNDAELLVSALQENIASRLPTDGTLLFMKNIKD
ncbi:hypothetical protein [Methylovulum psychrotolerans]|uniref:Uncharacterized protein n=1 Tax=Methylovulum psychrotolerans TaxID=1704499 RepID=A0A2S5CIL6_9GAMM|nr:hypothetical protein [Methylovulum psychrotolerans]POZ50658.1 hypothetical protein AADEFJLK_03555 [Methylovulum psychrotolerans]